MFNSLRVDVALVVFSKSVAVAAKDDKIFGNLLLYFIRSGCVVVVIVVHVPR